jgi:ribose-phosphate pyrophosphokinase
MTTLTLLSGPANPALAGAISEQLEVPLGDCDVQGFPDGELHVEIQTTVRGHDVYLVQPTSPPVQEHLLQLLLLADACRRAGAARITAVVPYFAYARHDRRSHGREAVAARLVADLIAAGGVQRVVSVDLHNPALEGFFGIPLEHLSAVPLLIEAVRPSMTASHVIVAPDLGAAKLADRYAEALHLPVAIVHKARLSGEEVKALRITGEVAGRSPLIVDDMISTGGTIEAAITALVAAGAQSEVMVATSHPLFVGFAARRLAAQSVQRCVVTDSVAGAKGRLLPIEVVNLGPLLADAIRRLHEDQSLNELLADG